MRACKRGGETRRTWVQGEEALVPARDVDAEQRILKVRCLAHKAVYSGMILDACLRHDGVHRTRVSASRGCCPSSARHNASLACTLIRPACAMHACTAALRVFLHAPPALEARFPRSPLHPPPFACMAGGWIQHLKLLTAELLYALSVHR